MSADFEVVVTVPADRRFGEMVRLCAAEGARHHGCTGPAVEAFGGAVWEAFRTCIGEVPAGTPIPVTVRVTRAGLEALLVCGRTVRIVGPAPSEG